MGKIRLTEAQLKSIIKKAVKRALCESSNYGTTLWGDDFVNVTIEKFGNGINEDEVLNDPNVDDIFQSKFEIKATYRDEPASWDSPGGTDFYIDEDDGLYDLIELIKNPELRDMFERAYDKLITTGDLGNYEFIGPEEPEYPELDETKTPKKMLREYDDEGAIRYIQHPEFKNIWNLACQIRDILNEGPQGESWKESYHQLAEFMNDVYHFIYEFALKQGRPSK